MSRRAITRAVLIVLAAYFALDLIVLDRWKLQGRVQAGPTQEGLEDAWVLASFWADEFLINWPFQPHPKHRTSKCIGAQITKTDQNGRFEFSELRVVPPLFAKRAYVVVFKPGWSSEATNSPISSALLAVSPQITLPAWEASTELQLTTKYSAEFAAGLEWRELARAKELFDVTGAVFAATSSCEYHHEVAVAALTYALTIARTFDERERVRVACRGVVKRLASLPEKHEWPYDCENPPFKHPPSESARALELKLEEKRRRWRELHPEG